MKKAMLISALALALAACGGSSSSGTTGTSSTTGGSTGSSGSSGTSGGTIDPGCGTVTVQGTCNSDNSLTYCSTGDLDDGGTGPATFSCNGYLPNNEPTQCGTVSAQWGVDCLAPTNQPCGFQDSAGNPIFVFCQGTTPGCFAGTNGFVCENSSACNGFPDGGFQNTCAGNQLQIGCQQSQAVGYDCASFGGSCSNAACVNIPRNGPCDTQGLVNCASGLTCTNLPDGGGHACE